MPSDQETEPRTHTWIMTMNITEPSSQDYDDDDDDEW